MMELHNTARKIMEIVEKIIKIKAYWSLFKLFLTALIPSDFSS